jgi:hypothetical protein
MLALLRVTRQVLRVQNKLLDIKYKQRQQVMQMTNEAAPLEMWLWHGAHPPFRSLATYPRTLKSFSIAALPFRHRQDRPGENLHR